MVRILFAITTSAIIFTGCGVSNGIGMGKQEVKKYFSKGELIATKKVLVDRTKISMLQGMGAGAVVGGVAGGSVQGAVIGGTAGAFGGIASGYALNGNEEEAWELTIRNGLQEVKGYTKQSLALGTILEYVEREDGSITNLRVLKAIDSKTIVYDEEGDYLEDE